MQGQKRARMSKIAKRRQDVAEMYFRLHLREYEIAERLGVSQPTISRDVAYLVEQARQSASKDVDEHRARELADLDEMERDSAIQFQATKDPRWMTERRMIKARRADMLGLDAPSKIAPTDPTGKEAWAGDVIKVVVHE